MSFYRIIIAWLFRQLQILFQGEPKMAVDVGCGTGAVVCVGNVDVVVELTCADDWAGLVDAGTLVEVLGTVDGADDIE